MSLLFGLLAPLLLAHPDPRPVQEGTFDSGGVPIRYVEAGKGETTVVLLHGFAANADLFALAGTMSALATQWHVVAMDARGHGRSGKPHQPSAYGREMVEDVVRLLDHLEIERAHVLGYSMGGMLVLDLVTSHPERVLSAVVGGFGWPEPAAQTALMERVARSLTAGEGFGPLFTNVAGGGRAPLPPERVALAERALLAANDPLALAAVARGFKELLPTEARLRVNEVPTLVIVGSLDPLAADVERLGDVMGRLAIVIIDGTDHLTAGTSPAFVSAVRRFFAASRPRSERRLRVEPQPRGARASRTARAGE